MQTIENLGKYTFQRLLKNSVNLFSERPALSFVSENPILYREFNEKINITKQLLISNGIRPYDKVAILAPSSPYWAISYFAIVTMGAIAVPLLPDFMPDEVCLYLTHSEAKTIFVHDKLKTKIENSQDVKLVIDIETQNIIEDKLTDEEKTKPEFDCELFENKEEDIASIIYTSGTTGKSKGVVLTHKNLIFTAIAGQTAQRINQYESALSMLPMSHVYEFTIGFLMFILNGACIFYLQSPPVPSVLLPALQEVRPNFILTVPLVIEKIYKMKILPAFSATAFARMLNKTKLGRKLLCRIAGKKLKKTFGGKIKFFGLGGAKTDPIIEQFMKDAKFPYSIGYGLTETSPLVLYSSVKKTIPGVLGIPVPGVSVKIDNPDPETGIGELVVKGPNVMREYFKAPDLTKEAFTEDGWFKTGDMCSMDSKGRFSLRGRSKNLILSPAGENIYPEDIEFVMSQHPSVSEALVVEGENTSIVAYVKLTEAVENMANAVMHKKEEILNEIKFFTNSKVNHFSKIDKIEVVKEFEKTASQKIKRYLYFFNKEKPKDEK